MNLVKYDCPNGEIISEYVKQLIKPTMNILFIRTPTTGRWLDEIEADNITRICYAVQPVITYCCKPSLSVLRIMYNKLETTLQKLQKTFDLIVIDPHHDYTISYNNFSVLLPFLTGMIVSHDCFPPSVLQATPTFVEGNWCGQTYLSFVKMAYTYPDLYYGIVNTDTGIGIISKQPEVYLTNGFNRDKQEQLLSMDFVNNYEMVYQYFVTNATELINIL